jgi:hypothetical protein
MSTETKYWTWDEILIKVRRDHDLEDEDFLDEPELREYANEAIKECEGIIHGLNEDYFLTRYPDAPFVDGVDVYELPESIYAHKIRNIIYFNGTDTYEIMRINRLDKFLRYRYSRANQVSGSQVRLEYFLANSASGNPRILVTPVPTGGTYEVWYYRNANRLDDLEDICDLPEHVQYVFDYLAERIAWKEQAGSAKHQTAIARLEKTKDNMLKALQGMIVDGHDDIEADTTAYEEHN